jgi:DNA polymerase-1
MVKISRRFEEEKLRSKMILQVHDELLFEVQKDELARVKKLVKHEMEQAVELSVPIVVEMGEGENWFEAH